MTAPSLPSRLGKRGADMAVYTYNATHTTLFVEYAPVLLRIFSNFVPHSRASTICNRGKALRKDNPALEMKNNR